MKFSTIVLVGFISLIFITPVWAATTLAPEVGDAPGVEDLSIQKVFGIIVGLACYLIQISIVLIVIAVIYYGFKFLISQGDPTKVGEAKKALGWGVVGIIVIFGTYTIIKTVNSAVGSTTPITILDCSGQ
jgi:hypothetical protein